MPALTMLIVVRMACVICTNYRCRLGYVNAQKAMGFFNYFYHIYLRIVHCYILSPRFTSYLAVQAGAARATAAVQG